MFDGDILYRCDVEHPSTAAALVRTTPPPQPCLTPPCTAFSQKWVSHCKYVPVLTSCTMLEELKQVEARYGVELYVVDQLGACIGIDHFVGVIQRSAVHDHLFKFNALGTYITSNTKRPYVWLVQHEGRMEELCRETSDVLTGLYSPSDKRGFILDGKEFVAEFDDAPSGTITEVLTGTVQKVVRTPLWTHFRPEHQHFPDDVSEAIEHIYQFGGPHIEIDGCNYTFDFNRMLLTSVPTCEDFVIRRQEVPQELPEPQITFELCGSNEAAVAAAKLEILWKLDSAMCISTPQQSQTLAIHSLVLNNVRQYCLQASGDLSQQLQLEGAKEYIGKATLLVRDQVRVLEASMSSVFLPNPNFDKFQQVFHSEAIQDFPREWEPQNDQCEFKAVLQDSVEWELVLNCVRQSIPTMIHKLERIQSIRLWEKFALEKKHLFLKNKQKATAANVSVLNERLLFHGTRNISPYEVAKSEKGFDLRKSHEKLRFGNASYFAEEASCSSQGYAHTTAQNRKQILIARVLVGFSKDYGKVSQPKLVEAPAMFTEDSGSVFKFDSVCGFIGNYRVYAIYDWEKTYPAYVVTYRD